MVQIMAWTEEWVHTIFADIKETKKLVVCCSMSNANARYGIWAKNYKVIVNEANSMWFQIVQINVVIDEPRTLQAEHVHDFRRFFCIQPVRLVP